MSLRLIFAGLLCLVTSAAFAEKPLALIYDGPGACDATPTTSSCAAAASSVANLAGFRVQYVGTEDANSPLFQQAQVWIQPGGEAKVQAQVMPKELLHAIKNFVSNGGGYVGFCAGGFMATEKFGWQTKTGPFEASGIGFFPGKSWYYDLFDNELSDTLLAEIINAVWDGERRSVYWEQGPYFQPSSVTPNTEIIAYYPVPHTEILDHQRIMAMRESFGKGRVFVSAVHPEAPLDWRTYYGLNDPDGVDYPLAQKMILWAAKKAN